MSAQTFYAVSIAKRLAREKRSTYPGPQRVVQVANSSRMLLLLYRRPIILLQVLRRAEREQDKQKQFVCCISPWRLESCDYDCIITACEELNRESVAVISVCGSRRTDSLPGIPSVGQDRFPVSRPTCKPCVPPSHRKSQLKPGPKLTTTQAT